jgi:hypothetical protein
MQAREDAAAIQTDAYIDTLLAAHAGTPILLPEPRLLPPPALRQTVELLERALPRIHPSFRFEQQLAARLRRAALAQQAGLPLPVEPGTQPSPAEVVAMPVALESRPEQALPSLPAVLGDRRVLLGGAIASGVSLAGAAMLAWRIRERGRTRRRWIA